MTCPSFRWWAMTWRGSVEGAASREGVRPQYLFFQTVCFCFQVHASVPILPSHGRGSCTVLPSPALTAASMPSSPQLRRKEAISLLTPPLRVGT